MGVSGIGRIFGQWIKAVKGTPRVTKPGPIQKTDLPTGNPTEEQTRYSANKQSEAMVYSKDGRMQGQGGGSKPKLDEGP